VMGQLKDKFAVVADLMSTNKALVTDRKELLEELEFVERELGPACRELDDLKNCMRERIGDCAGIEGPLGKVTWKIEGERKTRYFRKWWAK